MTVEERARLAHGKSTLSVSLCVEFYPKGRKDTTRAQIYEAVSKAITEAVASFGTVAGLKIDSISKGNL